MAKSKLTYLELQAELDDVMSRLQRDDVPVDEAVTLYEQGLALVKQLEGFLEAAEHKVRTIKADLEA